MPPDKPLYVLHDTAEGPETILACGRFSDSEDAHRWGPAGEFTCPQDRR